MKLPISITFYDAAQKSFTFETLESLSDFFKTEQAFWLKKFAEFSGVRTQPYPYLNSASRLQDIVSAISSWDQQIAGWDQNTFTQKLNELKSNYLNGISTYWLSSEHSYIDAWLASYSYSQETGDSFLEATFGKALTNISTYHVLRGYLLAYEFAQQEDSLITSRRKAEKQSFNSIKDQLIKKKAELIDDVTTFKDDLVGWRDATSKEVAALQGDQKEHYEVASLYRSNNFESRLSTWTQSVSDLETKYKEKLRFDGPATYWKKSAEKLKGQGEGYIAILIAISILFIFCLSQYFLSWLEGHPSDLKLESLEGVVLFASILSAFAILIRTFSRLAFSSFHLQRDAEEREQLTHLYLSLANETNVDDESRKIVLQALFSRSETGLLANDSGPTMPGVTDVVNLISRK